MKNFKPLLCLDSIENCGSFIDTSYDFQVVERALSILNMIIDDYGLSQTGDISYDYLVSNLGTYIRCLTIEKVI